MFNMEKIGKRIADLRRKKNMTQLDLADRLEISFQAVSNWERGSSMPDIAKLPELAKIFNVSIDEILGEKSPILNSAMQNELSSYVKNNEITKEELEDVSPLLKPSQVNEVVENIDITDGKVVASLLPYMDKDDVAALAILCLKNNQYQSSSIEVFLPYMYEDDVGQIVSLCLENNQYQSSSIEVFLPYMDEDAVKDLVKEILNHNQ